MEESELEKNIEDGLEENLVYINSINKYININNDIPITTAAGNTIESIEIIKSVIEKLYEQIDFLKDELQEKNLLIKILNFRNANDGEKINIDLVNENQLSVVETTSTSTTISSSTETYDTSHYNSQSYNCENNSESINVNIVDYDETSTIISSLTETYDSSHYNSQSYINIVDDDETSEYQLYDTVFNSTRVFETIETQINNYKIKHKEKFNDAKTINENLNILNNKTTRTCDYDATQEVNCEINDVVVNSTIPVTIDTTNSNYNDTSQISSINDDTYLNYNERFVWEKHSSGFASKMLDKMGYKGKGLGKAEDGIIEPITVTNSLGLGVPKTPKKRKLIYIASDSMLNQMEEGRLSKTYDIKVRCHGGCTIKCMYSHLPSIVKLKPEYIILHIGTNDCTSKTSDVVLK